MQLVGGGEEDVRRGLAMGEVAPADKHVRQDLHRLLQISGLGMKTS